MLLAVEELSHRYKDRLALDRFHLHLNRREILGLVGPNGSGKSTLLRILSTLVKPQSGRAEICGYDVLRHPAAVRERIGVVFQTTTLDRLLTVEENLRASGTLHGLHGRKLLSRVSEVLELFQLAARRHDPVKSLSGGLARRAELARAFLHTPQLLLLDEPSTGLDPTARLEFWRALETLRAESGAAILLTTHLFDEAERCDSLCFLAEGRRVAEGAPAELTAQLGGDVIFLKTPDPSSARQILLDQFHFEALERDGSLYLEVPQAHTWIPRLVESLPGPIDEIGFHRPTLADVYRKLTATV
jgi:ABC-2 type transport system ATP-binding protein